MQRSSIIAWQSGISHTAWRFPCINTIQSRLYSLLVVNAPYDDYDVENFKTTLRVYKKFLCVNNPYTADHTPRVRMHNTRMSRSHIACVLIDGKRPPDNIAEKEVLNEMKKYREQRVADLQCKIKRNKGVIEAGAKLYLQNVAMEKILQRIEKLDLTDLDQIEYKDLGLWSCKEDERVDYCVTEQDVKYDGY